ncbi:proton-conducting transporter transmembrane domain-containing protein [Desulfuribacillus alkaliarsenatis]|uniref:Cation:proton antiporter n=1 Tax=Desulfuribacillus alkaliarsenatis TaxID=766136 RepID=A0A1E5G461_9FIRM|nr:proton-conducting transporter membrane subunit [Desulfuribacillus alkaliarsenatis]OEF97865.1 cation:proton antiporter [Desulfuribacillus alkaliarsenatis]
MGDNILPVLAIVVPLIAVVLILLSKKYPNIREAWTIIAALLNLIIILAMVPTILAQQTIDVKLFYVVKDIYLHLRVDALGLLFAALAAVLWVVTSVFSIGYMRGLDSKNQTVYYASFALSLAATIGIAFSANLITFFIFYELLTIATYPLVIHKRNQEAQQAGRKYLIYTLVAGQLLLVGVVLVHLLAGTSDFVGGGILTADMAPAWVLQAVFMLLFIGTAVKAGVMPLHAWLPAAMVAPTPVSALLHAVAVVKAGAFGVYRIVGYVFGPELFQEIGMATAIAWIASITIIVSSLIAINQDHLKRRLAFSTIGQLSYVVLGIALATPYGFLGAGFHMVAHAFMKITLFFCAGAIYVLTKKAKESEMNGLGKQFPIIFAAFAVASIGIAGMPFIAGFISKFNIVLGAIQGGQVLFIVVMIASALLSLSYLMPVVYMAFFNHKTQGSNQDVAPIKLPAIIPKLLVIPIVITALSSVILGVYPNFIGSYYDLAALASDNVFIITDVNSYSVIKTFTDLVAKGLMR